MGRDRRSRSRGRSDALAEALVREILGDVRDPWPIEDAHHGDGVVVLEVRQQLGREHKALRCALGRGGAAQELVDLALVVGVHALVDFVHHAKGRGSQRLQAKQVQHRADAALAAALPLAGEPHELLIVAKLDEDRHGVLFVVIARLLEPHLAAAPDAREVGRVRVRDALNERPQNRQPLAPDFVHLRLGSLIRGLAVLCLALKHLDLLGAPLVLRESIWVGQHHCVGLALALGNCLLAIVGRVWKAGELLTQIVGELALRGSNLLQLFQVGLLLLQDCLQLQLQRLRLLHPGLCRLLGLLGGIQVRFELEFLELRAVIRTQRGHVLLDDANELQRLLSLLGRQLGQLGVGLLLGPLNVERLHLRQLALGGPSLRLLRRTLAMDLGKGLLQLARLSLLSLHFLAAFLVLRQLPFQLGTALFQLGQILLQRGLLGRTGNLSEDARRANLIDLLGDGLGVVV
mmetsp:Transcript_13434/g.56275  ORF Transcript_13434/g.56275 Transcript_13434/m.56275 type:complete len:460 (-) Transcript_13434:2026-3405(-)